MEETPGKLYTPSVILSILKKQLIDGVPLDQLCEDCGIRIAQFQSWAWMLCRGGGGVGAIERGLARQEQMDADLGRVHEAEEGAVEPPVRGARLDAGELLTPPPGLILPLDLPSWRTAPRKARHPRASAPPAGSSLEFLIRAVGLIRRSVTPLGRSATHPLELLVAAMDEVSGEVAHLARDRDRARGEAKALRGRLDALLGRLGALRCAKHDPPLATCAVCRTLAETRRLALG